MPFAWANFKADGEDTGEKGKRTTLTKTPALVGTSRLESQNDRGTSPAQKLKLAA